MIGRYQTAAMQKIWSDNAIFGRWTRIEIEASEAWHARGEIPADEMDQIRTAKAPSAERVAELEKVTDHDVVAFVRGMGESIPEAARRHLHRGLTSSDVVDTGLAMGMVESLDVLITAAKELAGSIKKRAHEFKLTPCAGRTHGVHAEPTTFGLRLAGFFSEMTRAIARLEHARSIIAFAKTSGAVGNFSQTDPDFEAFVLGRLGLKPEPIATQVVPRDRHAEVAMTLALLGGTIERMATEIRALQRTDIREAEEPFKTGQTGSSAMPHKKNPITSERLCGMARLLRGYAVAAMENMPLWHDRDISHSSVERVAVPDAFHLAHNMLNGMNRLITGLRVYPERMLENMERTGGLLFSQTVLGVLLSKGMDRQQAYAMVQKGAMSVWEKQFPHLKDALLADSAVRALMTPAELEKAFVLTPYTRHIDALFARAGL